ncbi:hypothetical protein BFJ72_g11809 [Fusarium proliferatum]|uniref:Uncharacterized protein n=1 Tax=Gibberella intermedia TaxID=948311 RepID=A0A420SL05_GIBIN|nr:hypothetical protein BFJ72_g11809 [Fusarium proliferatum]
MGPDDRDRHIAEPTSITDGSVDAELAPDFSQQVENTNNSNYLDSLDPSLLGSPDFDFSCLMDLDEAAEATQEPEHIDSMMLDAPAFEAPCSMDDLNMTQILTSKVFHGSDHPGTNLYLVHEAPQHQVYVPQFQVGPDSMTSMTSENYQFSTETPNTFENPSGNTSTDQDRRLCELTAQCLVEAFVHSVGMTPLMPELPQLSGFRDQRFIHINEPPTQAQVPLPRPSRPIRRGRLTREQAEGQARARENGVCIRCRRNGITRQVAMFCGDRCLDNPYEDGLVTNTSRFEESGSTIDVFVKTSWLLDRYVELQLFRYLQDAANNPNEDIYEQRNFTYSALYLLGHSFSTSSTKISRRIQNTSCEWFKNSIKDHLDRERRVRLALWIYVSITVGQLPSEASFWGNLPNELKAFRGGLPKKFRESFDGFNNSLHMNMKIEMGSKARFLQQVYSGQQTQDSKQRFAPASNIDHECTLWQSMMDNTAQGIHDICHLNSGDSTTFADRVREYEQIEAERLFLPTNQEHFKRVAENAFGTIMALARLPIRSQQTLPIRGCQVLRPSFLRIQAELHRFMGRLSSRILPRGASVVYCGEYPFLLHGADDIHLARWQELENMMGGGIFLVGNTFNRRARKASHAFLDIANVTDTGTDVQFLRLKRLLQKNGSWLRQVMHSMTRKDHELSKEFCDERYEKSLEVKKRHANLKVYIAKIQEVYPSW